jgi:hypothetical protein
VKEQIMEQLPDLRSDADVDALMARLRARLAPAAQPRQSPDLPDERSGNALRDFLAVQEEHAAEVLRAMQVIADTLEDLRAEAEAMQVSQSHAAQLPSNTASVAPVGGLPRVGRAPARRHQRTSTVRINGRRRKAQ